jgi:hypothetical protein
MGAVLLSRHDIMPPTRHEAIRRANAHLQSAGMPTYEELIVALRDGAGHMPHSSRKRVDWCVRVFDLLRKAGAA